MCEHLKVKNWNTFQSYKDRPMTWIKLHTNALEDFEFAALEDFEKGQLMSIWLLASRGGGKIPFDSAFIAKRINASEPVDLPKFVALGWLQTCVRTSVEGSTNVRTTEERREEDIPKKNQEEKEEVYSGRFLLWLGEVKDTWNSQAKQYDLPSLRGWSKARGKTAKARFSEPEWMGSWKEALFKIGDSDFCCGRIEARNGRSVWRADIDWFLRPDTVNKILEGKYDNQDRATAVVAGGNIYE